MREINKRIFSFILISGVFISSQQLKAKSFPEINLLANQCFKSSQPDSCKKALIAIEAFQVEADNLDNYRCQTRLLGLQADLIMTLHQLKRSKFSFDMLEESKQFCIDF